MKLWLRQAAIWATAIYVVIPMMMLVAILVFVAVAFAAAQQVTTIGVWRLQRQANRQSQVQHLMAEYRNL